MSHEPRWVSFSFPLALSFSSSSLLCSLISWLICIESNRWLVNLFFVVMVHEFLSDQFCKVRISVYDGSSLFQGDERWKRSLLWVSPLILYFSMLLLLALCVFDLFLLKVESSRFEESLKWSCALIRFRFGSVGVREKVEVRRSSVMEVLQNEEDWRWWNGMRKNMRGSLLNWRFVFIDFPKSSFLLLLLWSFS